MENTGIIYQHIGGMSYFLLFFSLLMIIYLIMVNVEETDSKNSIDFTQYRFLKQFRYVGLLSSQVS